MILQYVFKLCSRFFPFISNHMFPICFFQNHGTSLCKKWNIWKTNLKIILKHILKTLKNKYEIYFHNFVSKLIRNALFQELFQDYFLNYFSEFVFNMFPSLFQDFFQNVYDTTKEGGPGACKKGYRDGDLGDLWQETPL